MKPEKVWGLKKKSSVNKREPLENVTIVENSPLLKEKWWSFFFCFALSIQNGMSRKARAASRRIAIAVVLIVFVTITCNISRSG